jgi:hypothetical protein
VEGIAASSAVAVDIINRVGCGEGFTVAVYQSEIQVGRRVLVGCPQLDNILTKSVTGWVILLYLLFI